MYLRGHGVSRNSWVLSANYHQSGIDVAPDSQDGHFKSSIDQTVSDYHSLTLDRLRSRCRKG